MIGTSDIAIVVPSRRRAACIPRIREILPSAYFYVDEREADDYKDAGDKLVLHSPTNYLADVRNLLIEHFQEKVIVQIDDDLTGIVQLPKGRKLTNPESIFSVIYNAAVISEDMDVGVFCWNRNASPMHFNDFDPIALSTGFVSSSFGVRGEARHRLHSSEFAGLEDMDFTMQAYLLDRIMFCDKRFYFDHGKVFGQHGGAVGITDKNRYETSLDNLQSRWGAYVNHTYGKRGNDSKLSVHMKIPRKYGDL